MTRLFEKTTAGLLVEVHPDQAEAKRAGRRCSAVSLVIDVLWTPEEEAARDAEEAAHIEAERQQARGLEMASRRRADARARLTAKGISLEDIKDALE